MIERQWFVRNRTAKYALLSTTSIASRLRLGCYSLLESAQLLGCISVDGAIYIDILYVYISTAMAQHLCHN